VGEVSPKVTEEDFCDGGVRTELMSPFHPYGRQAEGVPVKGFSLWERGRENGSFPVEEGKEVKDRVLETVGFQGANPICDGGGRT